MVQQSLPNKKPDMLELIEAEVIENVTLSYAEDKGAALSPEHRGHLEGRHGTVNKTPLPSADPEDPLNWPDWKKNTALLTLALHSLIATYSPNAISPAFIIISRDLGVSVTAATYLLSATLLPMGLSSFLWIPISNRFGRRPMWLMASLLPACFNLGLALTKDFPTMVVLQVLSGLFLSPSLTLVSAVITELFFVEERGQKMGLWTSALNLGPPCAPFLMGFVVERTNTYKYIYYVQAAALILVFFLHIFCTPETMYKPRLDGLDKSNFKHQYVAIEKYPDSPLDVATFAFPLKLFAYPNIVIPAIIQAVVLNFAGIFMTVEIPVIYPQIYGSTPSKVGCQFIGLLVGTVIGGWLGGRGSDIWMEQHRKKVGDRAEPEHRVWLCYPGYVLCLIGVLAFCIGLARSTHLHYTVVPTVGASIFAAGNQVIGNVMITYSVDCHARYSHTIGFFFNMWRTVLGFIGPFCYPSMIENCGYYGLAGVMLACVAALSLAPTIAVQVAGKRFRIHKHGHEGAME